MSIRGTLTGGTVRNIGEGGRRRRLRGQVLELRLDLNTAVARLIWDTHGLEDCILHWSESSDVIPIDGLDSLRVVNTDRPSQHWWITGPGGVRSNVAYAYGPRCTITDLRTRFSQR